MGRMASVSWVSSFQPCSRQSSIKRSLADKRSSPQVERRDQPSCTCSAGGRLVSLRVKSPCSLPPFAELGIEAGTMLIRLASATEPRP
jgi:hypothetical protein